MNSSSSDKHPALRDAIAYCIKAGTRFAREVLAFVAMKTTGSFQANLWAAVQHLYDTPTGFGQMEFAITLEDIVTVELTQAWKDGMRSLGLDPDQDNTEEGDLLLELAIATEMDQLPGLEGDIVDAARADPQEDINQFRSRISLWVNRYNDVKNQSIFFYAALGQRMK